MGALLNNIKNGVLSAEPLVGGGVRMVAEAVNDLLSNVGNGVKDVINPK